MTAPGDSAQHEGGLSGKVAEVIAASRAAIYGGSPAEPFIEQALQNIPAAVAQSEDFTPALAALQQTLLATERLQKILREALTQVEAQERLRARKEMYGDRWWLRQLQELNEVFRNDPAAGVDRWLQTFVHALVDGEVAFCLKWIQAVPAFSPSATDLSDLLLEGMFAISGGTPGAAIRMLEYLVSAHRSDQSSSLLDPIARAALYVCLGRILLPNPRQRPQALANFQQARELAPNDGLPYAGMGDYTRAENETRQALRFYQQAFERSPNCPDGYLGMGLLAEDQQRWDEADAWYDRAIEAARGGRDIETGLSRLLAPSSANLLLRLARALKDERPEDALRLTNRAIAQGIRADGGYPERLGYRLKGEILAKLDRSTEAAEAFYEAGRRWYWNNALQPAIELFELAHRQNDRHMPTYWYWADSLAVTSFISAIPYVDERKIQESLSVWERGAELCPPDAEYSWAYVSRAIISEQLAQLPGADRWEPLWEGVVNMERALLFEEDAYRWAVLARLYRKLNLEMNALDASEKAVSLDPNNISALEELAASLANAGRFEEAETANGKSRELAPNCWVNAVRVYILIHLYKWDEALGLINQVIEESPGEFWYRYLRALIYRTLGDSRADEDYRWIWSGYDPDNSGNQYEFGSAALNLGMLDEAIEIFERLRADPTQESAGPNASLGACYLKKGDYPRAEDFFQRAIDQSQNVRQLDGLINIDFKPLEAFAAASPDSKTIFALLDSAREKAEAKRAEISRQLRSVEDELADEAAKQEREGNTSSWAWLGSLAGLARIPLKRQCWSDAALNYRKLLESDPQRFPQARRGLTAALDGLQAQGDRSLRESRSEEALDCYLRAYSYASATLADQIELSTALLCRIGFAHFAAGDTENARRRFSQALQAGKDSEQPSPGENLASTCRTMLRDAKDYWSLDEEWRAWADASDIDAWLRSQLAAARSNLAGYLNELYRLSPQSAVSTAMLPVVTPVAAEIGLKLIPGNDSDDSPLFKTHLPALRERLEREMGVRVPGVRIRGNEGDLPAESYVLMLDEIPLVMGSLSVERRYSPESPARLTALGIPDSELAEAAHPLTGQPGCWVAAGQWDLVRNHGLELWEEPILFMIFHLEALLRRNLADFLGVQEVENMIEIWQQNEEHAPLIESALPNAEARSRLASLLRALVKEQVPIARWTDILEAVKDLLPNRDDPDETLRAARLKLKDALPGNQRTVKRLRLPLSLEESIRRWIWREGGKTFFALPPEDTQELLAELRELTASKGKNTALVTAGHDIRVYLRRLVELEFPDLMVMAQEELLEPIDGSDAAGEA